MILPDRYLKKFYKNVFKENEYGKAIVWRLGRLPESCRVAFGWAAIFHSSVAFI